MIEFALGVLFSPILFFILCILAIASDYADICGVTVFLQIVLFAIVWKTFAIAFSWPVLGWVLLAYLPMGFVWSFWRWYRHCRDVNGEIEEAEKNASDNRGNFGFRISSSDLRCWREKLDPRKNKSTIAYWVICWPFSLIVMMFDDLFDIVKTFIIKFFKSIYNRIAAKALGNLNKLEEERQENERKLNESMGSDGRRN